jgi:UDP-2,4-diacetamido-2,4,6-trideoxy-beta-L-altropyranose hydrolase
VKILFRADASIEIGTGHIMRCLALADTLKEKGSAVTFICREHTGNLCSLIAEKGFTVHRLGINTTPNPCPRLAHAGWLGADQRQDAVACLSHITSGVDWLVVDHYALDAEWESLMRPHARRLMAIDDLADRKHDCDLLVDQNLAPEAMVRYRGLVPKGCGMLLGPRYALLRKEFYVARERKRDRDGCVKRIFIYFGGSDQTNETAKALNAVRLLNHPELRTDVILGRNYAWKDDVIRAAREITGVTCHAPCDGFAQTMWNADLAIMAGGVARWECASLGVPMILLGVADNQRPGILELARTRAAIGFPDAKRVSAHDLAELLHCLFERRSLISKLSSRCAMLTDARGAQRVAAIMASLVERNTPRDVTIK